MNGLLPVLLPCPGRPACPAEWFESPGHQHFMRAGRRVRVRRLLAGCWEVLCPCCRERPVVAQVGTWERAMWRAGEHVREVHGATPVVGLESEQQLHARRACPGWEYATTVGPRKQWDDQDRPPCDEDGVPDRSWERNVDAGRDGWERFDCTEESYWRRRREAHPVLSAREPEPPAGTVVRDDCGTVWVNDGHRPCCWVRPDAEVHDPESWTKVAGNYGPVTVLEWGEDDGA